MIDLVEAGPENHVAAHPRKLPLAFGRAFWAATIILALIVFGFTLPVRYNQLVAAAVKNRPYLDHLGLSARFFLAYLVAFDTMAMLTFVGTAAVLVLRKANDWLALFASAMLTLVGVLLTRPVESMALVSPFWHLPFILTLAIGGSTIILFMFLFPDGRYVPPWTRWVARGWILWIFAWYLVPVWLIEPMPWPPRLQPGWAVAGWLVSGLAVQIYRFRAVSTPSQRQQTRWVVLGLVVASIGFLAYVYIIPTVFPSLREPGLTHLVYILAGVPLLYISILFVPLAIGISILRYRLWDIGVFVNRTLVYGLLTVLLTAVYLGLVLLLQPFFRAVTGHNSLLAMAVSTLATAVLVYPLRQRVQAGIDRHLFPRKYDAAQVIVGLSAALRDEVDLTRLTEQLERAISEIIQPASVFSWLRTPQGFRVYLFDEGGNWADFPIWVNGVVPFDDPLVPYLTESREDITALETLKVNSGGLEQLRAAGVIALVLLRSRGELIGWLSLGPRTNQEGYSADDWQFLSLVAAQAGPAVRVAQLALEQQAAALEKQRLAQQLRLARLVQQTLLPHEWPEMPGWEIAGHYRPAQAVGGDFYDFLSFKDGRCALVIGDVSDKGIPASLVMAATRSLLRSVAYQFIDPEEVLRRTNRLLLPDLPEGLFVTCLYAVLDPVTGRLTLANAGHNLPFCHGAQGVAEIWATGMPLGWMPDATYEGRELTLEPGDCLLFYSDGLTEALNPAGDLFGVPRLEALLAGIQAGSSDVIERLLAELADFVGPQGPDDDVTILALTRDPVLEVVRP